MNSTLSVNVIKTSLLKLPWDLKVGFVLLWDVFSILVILLHGPNGLDNCYLDNG